MHKLSDVGVIPYLVMNLFKTGVQRSPGTKASYNFGRLNRAKHSTPTYLKALL